jgi:hypothetical protein
MTTPTIVQAINDKDLFRPVFRKLKTWGGWMVLLKALFALPMAKKELALYRECTGREKAPQQPYRELWAIVGRRGGKSFIMSVIAVFLALFHDFKQYLAVGERGTIQVIAADRPQARVIFRYISAILNSTKVFSRFIQNETKERIELTTGIDIEVMTCSFRTIRGRTVVCAICDEIAFWRVEGANPDKEILAAIRPSMATIPNSMLLVISSPYARSGVLYEHHRDYFGKDENEVLVWQAPTKVMNPTISRLFIGKERLKDPSAARAEYDAQFRDDIEDFLTVEAIDAVVVPGRRELAPDPHLYHFAFVDPSGGRADAFSLTIGHRDGDIYVIDLIRGWRPPFDPDDICQQIADICRAYRVTQVTGDKYAGVWVPSAFEKAGLNYRTAPLPKSDLYLAFEAYVNTRRVELLDNQHLITELRSLERRRGRAGKDSVDHPPRLHDDLANAVAGCCHLLSEAPEATGGQIDLQYGDCAREYGMTIHSPAGAFDMSDTPTAQQWRGRPGGDW